MIESLARHIMKKICFSAVCFFLNFYCFTQDINVTFTPTGEATSIDSVTALNQRTKLSVTLPGDETLVLRQSTGIENVYSLGDQIMVYPNPFAGDSKVTFTINEPQKVNLLIQNMTGQVVVMSEQWLQNGNNEFEISISDNGLYVLVVETKQGYECSKFVNLSSSGRENKINYAGSSSYLNKQSRAGDIKSGQTDYSLDYSIGDYIHYTCYSGVMTTIFTDSPESSKNHDVGFAQCTDPDGKTYQVVRIGDHVWMAENLAYLPLVSPSNIGSDSEAHYYVYGYEGTSVSEAKSTVVYEEYGVLYNWQAANYGKTPGGEVQETCPEGWHLPSEEEWTILTDYLTNNGYGYGSSGSDIGKSMASTSGWDSSSDAGDIGNNQSTNNISGFNAFPGGYRYRISGFDYLGKRAFFWSSSEYDSLSALRWYLRYSRDDVRRFHHYRSYGFSVRCIKDSE